jgi:hypothetical protein
MLIPTLRAIVLGAVLLGDAAIGAPCTRSIAPG